MTFADDAGEYSIFVKNSHGEVSASASLLEEGIQRPFVSLSNAQFHKRIFYVDNHLNALKKKLCGTSGSQYFCIYIYRAI